VAAAGLPGCDEKDPTGTDVTTSSEGARVGAVVSGDSAGDGGISAAIAATDVTATGTIALPINQTVTSSATAFSITQKGTGGVGSFKVDNPANGSSALFAQTNGAGYAVRALAFGNAVGGLFEADGLNSDGLKGYVPNGNGNAVHGVTVSMGGRAGLFENLRSDNSNSALAVRTMGSGTAGVFLAPNGGKGLFVNSKSSTNTLEADNSGTGFAAQFFGYGSAKGVYIQTQGGAGLQVQGGTKNAVVATPSGAKALYTEESTEVWFTDYGFGRLANGRARVLLDPSFAQTINPDESYHVFLQARGRAELYIGETTPLGFEVVLKDGDPSAEFSYRIVAKRLGFEEKRLERAPWADHVALPVQR